MALSPLKLWCPCLEIYLYYNDRLLLYFYVSLNRKGLSYTKTCSNTYGILIVKAKMDPLLYVFQESEWAPIPWF